MRFIDGDELRRLVPMTDAIEAVERAFRSGDAQTPPRRHVPFGDGELLFMPSSSPRGAGVKLVTINPGNADRGLPLIGGTYVVFDQQTLQPAAVIDAAALTAIRTAAVSAVATRALSHPDSEHLVIFGAGTQAHAHLEAMMAVRPIAEIGVVSRSEERARALVEKAFSLGLVGGIDDPVNSVGEADIICTCTTSPAPVFEGRYVNAGTHINAVGSYKKEARELDSDAVARAALVVVEAVDAIPESGDLAIPIEEGKLDPDSVRSLADVLDGPQQSERGITLFKSVGRAFEDLAVAEAALEALG